jgi:DNA polymerase I-like protein with 3'-5' exonuclease and polymerase domains
MVSPLANVQLHLVETLDDAYAFKRWAGERRETPVGLDTESSGLSPHNDKLRLIQFGDIHQGWAIPWDLWGGVALEIFHHLVKKRTKLVLHNSSFDMRFMQMHAGIDPPWHLIDDTMAMAHLLDPLRPKGLKTLAAKLIDRNATGGEKALHDGMRQQGWTWGTVPLDFAPYWVYSALDPVLTAMLWQQFQPEITASYSEAYDLEMAATRICANMMLKGVQLDTAWIHEKITGLREYSLEARAWLKDAYGVTSPNSSKQIAAALNALGVPTAFFTETGLPRMDKDALEAYNQIEDPAVQSLTSQITGVRKAEKIIGTYLENFLEKMDAGDILHCQIWTTGARTSRMSISEPSMQNLPRDDKIVRGAIIPRDGHVLISCDLDQVEMRLGAHFSGDQGLINAFHQADQPGQPDFFTVIASELFGEPVYKNDRRRDITKNVGYGYLFGAGADTMAHTAKLPVASVSPVRDAFSARYPGLHELAQRITSEAEEHNPPSIITPMGRRLVMDKGRVYTQALNALIQGHAAEYLKKALIDVESAGLGNAMLLPVHDEIVCEVAKEDADEALHTIQEAMTNRTDYRVPITASGKVMSVRWEK